MTSSILVLSIGLQFVAAGLAFQLLRKTGRIGAWLFITAALVLMGARRLFSLVQVLSSPTRAMDPVAEILALLISLLMLAGVVSISKVFDRFQRMQSLAEDELEKRKRAEAALQSSEQKLRLLTDNMVDAISQINAERTIVYCSPSVERVYGYTPQDLIGRNAYEKVHPEDAERVRQHALDAIAARSGSIRCEYRYLHAGGEYVWVESSIRLLYGENGEYTGAILGSRDITGRKRTEENLRQANLVIENSPVVLFRWRVAEGWPLAMVSQNVDQFGYTAEELLAGALTFADMVHPDDLDRMRREIAEYAAGGVNRYQQTYRIVTRDGRTRWVDDYTVVERNPDGQIAFYQGIVIDVTERRLAEESLIENNQFIASLLRAIPVAVFYKDDQGRYLGCNDTFSKIMGVTTEEIKGKTVNEIWPGELAQNYHEMDLELMRNREHQEYEFQVKATDGRMHPVIFAKDVFLTKNGEVAGLVGAFLDITERKRTEEALRLSEERYAALIAATNEGVFDWDLVNASAQVSDRWLDLCGFATAGSAPSMEAWRGTVHPEDIGRVDQSFQDHLAGKAPIAECEYRIRDGLGGEKWVRGRALAVRDRAGTLVRVFGTVADITARKLTEKSIQESRNLLQMVLDTIPVRVFWKDRNLNYLGCNHPFARDIGLRSPQDIVGKTDFDLCAHEQAERYRRDDRQVIESNTPKLGYEEPYTAPDGRLNWLSTSKAPLRNTDGEIVGVLCTYENITARKAIEKSLQREQEFIRALLENMLDGVVACDAEGKLALFNRTAREWHGLDATETPQEEWASRYDLYAGDGVTPLTVESVPLVRAFRGQERLQNLPLVIRAQGQPLRYVTINCVPFYDTEGQLLGAMGVMRDQTEARRAELALKESEERFRQVVESAPMPIGISDAAGRIEYLNPRFQQTFGYAPDELATVEHWLQRAYPDADYRQAMEKRWEQAIAQAVQDQRPSDALDARVTCRDGSVRIMQVFGAVVGGRLIAVFNDLTDRIRSEDALRASLAEKETLLKEVHHRVKNNLQVISSLLSLQFRQIKSPDLRVFLHDTQNRIRSMAMVHEILYRSGDISALSFTGYVKNLCEHLSRSYGSAGRRIRLINHIADVRLDLDHAIVAGLIVNELVTNALKHAFGSRPEGEIRVELQPAGEGRLALRVSDNGDGLPADAPLEGPGTLGLLLVKNLARQLDGELAVRSDYGSLFEVSFPLNLPEGKMVPQTP